jgi:hypothetical protein
MNKISEEKREELRLILKKLNGNTSVEISKDMYEYKFPKTML